MSNFGRRWLLACLALLISAAACAFSGEAVPLEQLPAEARNTLRLIDAGGPFPHKRDGVNFHNRENRLPMQTKGYYREYTVATPGERTRGARRIVTGGKPPEVYYYTPDHYGSFQRIVR